MPEATSPEVIVGVLNLVDYVLMANLILIVILSGYETFVARIEAARHPGLPEGLGKLGFGSLKQKLLGSVVALAAVEMLKVFMNFDKYADTSKVGWLIGMQLTFIISLVILAVADRLGADAKAKDG